MVYLRCLIVTVGSEAKREGGGKMSSARSCEGSAAVALRCREAEACNSCNLYVYRNTACAPGVVFCVGSSIL